MSKIPNADEILMQARPVLHQHGHETQPYGHLAGLPIALDASRCKPACTRPFPK